MEFFIFVLLLVVMMMHVADCVDAANATFSQKTWRLHGTAHGMVYRSPGVPPPIVRRDALDDGCAAALNR